MKLEGSLLGSEPLSGACPVLSSLLAFLSKSSFYIG